MAVEQRVASFMCIYTNSIDVTIYWEVNGMRLSWRGSSNVTANTQSTDGVVSSVLSVGTLLEYNNSRIRCLALSYDGLFAYLPVLYPVKLHIQGFIHIVLQ